MGVGEGGECGFSLGLTPYPPQSFKMEIKVLENQIIVKATKELNY